MYNHKTTSYKTWCGYYEQKKQRCVSVKAPQKRSAPKGVTTSGLSRAALAKQLADAM